MRKARILVLGSTGFVGRNFVSRLGLSQHQINAPARIELDVTNFAAAERYLKSHSPDVVVNCAAATGIGTIESCQAAAETLNVAVPAFWAALCAAEGCRLIHFSTDQVFSGSKRNPYVESDPAEPTSAYGETKLRGERAVLSHASHLVIRTSFVFGAGGNTFMSKLPRLLADPVALRVVTDMCGSCTAVTDLCEAVIGLLERDACGLFHVANRDDVTWEAFARQCCSAMLSEGYVVRCPEIKSVSYASMQAALGPRALYSVLDVTKAECALGRPMRRWTDCIPPFVVGCLGPIPATCHHS